MKKNSRKLPVIGWREWLSISALSIPNIKAKVDTGAKTSALHTFDLEIYENESGESRARFKVHPLQNNTDYVVECDEKIVRTKSVKDSGGHEEMRPFIRVPVTMGDLTWEIDMSLTNRDNMLFRMLLGRAALKKRFLVNSGRSYLVGSKPQSSAS